MPKEDNKAAARRVLEAFNTGNTSIIDEIFEQEFRSHTKPFPGVAATRDGLKDEIRKLREAFPDAQFTETGISEQGNTVTINWSMTGTHKAPILGVEPSGEKVTQTGQEVLEFRGGRISGRRGREEHEEFHQKLQANAARKHGGGGGGGQGGGR
ncbi:MAG TPA: ester cyclase [Longimicrobium sp.]|nr:ester cyclase [Longimicrobium sp.]